MKLTNKQVADGNKLIAKFEGFEFVTVGYIGTKSETKWQKENKDWMDKVGIENVGQYVVNLKEDLFHELEDVKYHSSWDCLIPVVDNCTKLANNLEASEMLKLRLWQFITNDIQSVWKAIVKFIKWYNANYK